MELIVYQTCVQDSIIAHLFLSSSSHRREAEREQKRGQGKAQGRGVTEDEGRQQQGKETVPVGVCQSMCPAREFRDREKQNRLHRFEMLAGTERDRLPRGDPLRAVKEYARPAAGKDSTNPTDLRPPDVLLKTVCYLIDDIAASPHLHPWTEASNISASCSQSPIFCSSVYIRGIFLL